MHQQTAGKKFLDRLSKVFPTNLNNAHLRADAGGEAYVLRIQWPPPWLRSFERGYSNYLVLINACSRLPFKFILMNEPDLVTENRQINALNTIYSNES